MIAQFEFSIHVNLEVEMFIIQNECKGSNSLFHIFWKILKIFLIHSGCLQWDIVEMEDLFLVEVMIRIFAFGKMCLQNLFILYFHHCFFFFVLLLILIRKLLPRERASLNYSNKLKQKFKYAPELKRILRHQHLPKLLFRRKQVRHIQKVSQRRKLQNILKHSKPGSIRIRPEKKKKIVEVLEWKKKKISDIIHTTIQIYAEFKQGEYMADFFLQSHSNLCRITNIFYE